MLSRSGRRLWPCWPDLLANCSKYQSTAFLDALLSAKSDFEQNGDSARLHIICLDEMNLARVEYYFATFLSKLQQKERIIYLLPKDLDLIAEDKDSILHTYRHFEIPHNVRFVGTLNMDESAQGLSPKVIDRCFFIEFEKGTSKQQKRVEDPGYYPASLFLENLDIEMPENETGVFAKLATENARFKKYAYQMHAVANLFEIDDNLLGDYLVLCKVLPRLRKTDEFSAYQDKIGFEKSNARFKQFERYGDSNQFCDYWRKR